MKLGELCPTRKQLIESYSTASTLYAQKISAFKDAIVSPQHDAAFAEMRGAWQVCEDARRALDQHVREHQCDQRQAGSSGG
jgi:hypothetical protein